jgi:hypothetical protein
LPSCSCTRSRGRPPAYPPFFTGGVTARVCFSSAASLRVRVCVTVKALGRAITTRRHRDNDNNNTNESNDPPCNPPPSARARAPWVTIEFGPCSRSIGASSQPNPGSIGFHLCPFAHPNSEHALGASRVFALLHIFAASCNPLDIRDPSPNSARVFNCRLLTTHGLSIRRSRNYCGASFVLRLEHQIRHTSTTTSTRLDHTQYTCSFAAGASEPFIIHSVDTSIRV